jgi:hypothetical protein
VESLQYIDVTDGRLPSRSFYDQLRQLAPRQRGAPRLGSPTPAIDAHGRSTAQVQQALEHVINRHETWQVGLFEVHDTINQLGIYLYAEVKDLDRLDILATAVARDYRKYLADQDIQAQRRREDAANEPDKSSPAWTDWAMRQFDIPSVLPEMNYLKDVGVRFLWYPRRDLHELPEIARQLVRANEKLGLLLALMSVHRLSRTPPFAAT